MLEEELYIICKEKNIIWPKMFKRFIDDGFGVIKSNKKEFSIRVNEFNCLRENIFIDKWQFGNNVAFMDLQIFKGENFYNGGKLSIKYIKNRKINICIFRTKAHTQDIRSKTMLYR